MLGKHVFRDSIVVSISACHADDPGSIPGRGVIESAIHQNFLRFPYDFNWIPFVQANVA